MDTNYPRIKPAPCLPKNYFQALLCVNVALQINEASPKWRKNGIFQIPDHDSCAFLKYLQLLPQIVIIVYLIRIA